MLALFEHIGRFIKSNKLLPVGSKVLVAYSGGSDSTLVAYALKEISRVHKMRWSLQLAHFHHGVDDEDEKAFAVVEENAQRFELKLHLRFGKLGQRERTPGTSLQMLARKMRYRYFLDVAREEGISYIVTAHQLDDQAETVLMRAIGGSWLTALSGIPVRRPLARGAEGIQVVRPLLQTPRSEILNALRELDLPFHDDASNKNLNYRRNAVRHRLMPMVLHHFNPAARQHMAALAQQAGELDVDLSARAKRFLPDLEWSDERCWLDIKLSTLLFEPRLQQRYIVREALLLLGVPVRHVTFRRVESALLLASDERRSVTVQITGNTFATVTGKDLRLYRVLEEEQRPHFQSVDVVATPQGGWHAEPTGSLYRTISFDLIHAGADKLEGLLDIRPPDTEYIDAAKVEFPLTVRARRDGDRFKPLGMKDTKKLQDYFTDRKVERGFRDRVPLVCDEKGIIWVVGQGIDERVRVSESTTKMLRLSAELIHDHDFPAAFEMDTGEDHEAT